MWKWLKFSYYIDECADSYGNKKYYVGRKWLGLHNAYLSFSFDRLKWSNESWNTPLEYSSVDKAELGLQSYIWQRAFIIKSRRKDRFKSKRSINIPPWGNK